MTTDQPLQPGDRVLIEAEVVEPLVRSGSVCFRPIAREPHTVNWLVNANAVRWWPMPTDQTGPETGPDAAEIAAALGRATGDTPDYWADAAEAVVAALRLDDLEHAHDRLAEEAGEAEDAGAQRDAQIEELAGILDIEIPEDLPPEVVWERLADHVREVLRYVEQAGSERDEAVASAAKATAERDEARRLDESRRKHLAAMTANLIVEGTHHDALRIGIEAMAARMERNDPLFRRADTVYARELRALLDAPQQTEADRV